MLAFQRLLCKFVRERSLRYAGIVNLTRSSQPSWPLSFERGQPCRRAKDFSAPNRRATDGRRISPLLNLAMPARRMTTVFGFAEVTVSDPLRGEQPTADRAVSAE